MTEEEFEDWASINGYTTHDGFGSRYEAVRLSKVRALFARLKAEREWVAKWDALKSVTEDLRAFYLNEAKNINGNTVYRAEHYFAADALRRVQEHMLRIEKLPPLPETKEPRDR